MLADDEIHVWLTDLARPPARLAELTDILTEDERERAAQFHDPGQRDGFIVGRGLLREVLGRYLRRPAAALRFGRNAHGKPALADAGSGSDLHFNLSHSGGRALLAVARRKVGVDLERLDRRVSQVALAERICTPREWTAFQAAPPARRSLAFFICWTRKEASAKALGDGLASGLRALDVCFPAESHPADRACWTDGLGGQWSVLNLRLAAGWMGALAAADRDWRWRGWLLPDPLGMASGE